MESLPADAEAELSLLAEIRARRRSWAAVKAETGFDGRRVILDEIRASLTARRPIQQRPGKRKVTGLINAIAAGKPKKDSFRDVLDAVETVKAAAVLENLEAQDRAHELDCEKLEWQKKNPGRGMSARIGPDGTLQLDLFDGMSDAELDAAIAAERRRSAELEAAIAET